MKTTLCLLHIGLLLLDPLSAQEAVENNVSGEINTVQSAVKTRASLTGGIANNQESAQKALKQLRSSDNPSGLQVSQDESFGFAAIDIGSRLLAAGKKVAAKEFFEASEVALTRAVSEASDDDSYSKAQILQKRAYLRDRFLRRGADALEDIEAAIKLQPDDEYLSQLGIRIKRKEDARRRVLAKLEGRVEVQP